MRSCGVCSGESDTGAGFLFHLSVSLHRWFELMFMFMLLLSEGQAGETCEPSEHRGHRTDEYFYFLILQEFNCVPR